MRNRFFLIAGIIIVFILAIAPVLKFSKNFIHSPIKEFLTQADNLERKVQLLESKAIYQKLINDFSGSQEVENWQEKVEELNLKIIFSPRIIAASREYTVLPLDNLTKIAKQFGTTVELIKKSNNLASDNINPGRKLKIWLGKFSILVDKSQNILILKSGDEILKSYVVSTGANNSSPVGTFKIVNKLVDPSWYKTGAVIPAGSPENILGTRWMGFDLATYGIHGTSEPKSLGAQATAGCVRMLNAEVEELYTFLPVGTQVTIVD